MNYFRDLARDLDAWAWQSVFGEADYMQLHPPVGLRLKMLSRFPGQLISPSRCERPIFIVGCPRSGTTLLYNLLKQVPGIQSLGQESHWIWEYFHPPCRSSDYSQVLREDDLTFQSRRFILACYGAAFGTHRFVDKCPTNTLRIGAIRALFPSARIVALTRNGPDNISSLIDTWTDPERFTGFDVPLNLDIDGYNNNKWVHVLQPGWQEYTAASIEEVCAHQWRTMNQAVLDAEAQLPGDAFYRVRYEAFFDSPVRTLRSLVEQLDLPFSDDLEVYVSSLNQHVVNTKSSPKLGKWRSRNPTRVSHIFAEIEDTMGRLGYKSIQRIDADD